MDDELVEHAARVLRRAPDGALGAAALYDLVSRETGIRCGVRLMLDRLATMPARFAILPAADALGETYTWDGGDRVAYGLALAAAGAGASPRVTLCEDPDTTSAGAPDPVPHGHLRDVHRSVAMLLRTARWDGTLLADVSSAMAALDSAGPGRQRRRRRRP